MENKKIKKILTYTNKWEDLVKFMELFFDRPKGLSKDLLVVRNKDVIMVDYNKSECFIDKKRQEWTTFKKGNLEFIKIYHQNSDSILKIESLTENIFEINFIGFAKENMSQHELKNSFKKYKRVVDFIELNKLYYEE